MLPLALTVPILDGNSELALIVLMSDGNSEHVALGPDGTYIRW